MSDAAVLDLARQALTISAKLALPILLEIGRAHV